MIDALRELPHRQRTALVLRYYEELGIDDIADDDGDLAQLGQDASAARPRRARAAARRRRPIRVDAPRTVTR